MKSSFRIAAWVLFVLLLAILTACGGGGGGGSSAPPPPPPVETLVISTSTLPDGVAGKAYSSKFEATGGQGTRTWKLLSGPTWLTINSATGEISGTPTDLAYNGITVEVRDTGSRVATKTFTLWVYNPLQIVSPPGGTLGLDYRGEIWTQGGFQPKQLVITGSMPPGLSATLTEWGTGTITGTPTQAGSFTFKIEVADRAQPPQVLKTDITMVIDTHVAIATNRLKYGIVGRAYSDTPTVINGTAPFTWSATNLPTGLSINTNTGEITGTPQAEWQINPNITVTDSSNPPQLFSRFVQLQIYGKLAYTGSNPVYTANAGNLSMGFGIGGGVLPLTFTIVSGQLPPGVTLDAYGARGTAAQGDYEFTARAQDSASPPQVIEQPYAMHILPPSLYTYWGGSVKARVGRPFSYQMTASGGTAPFTWQLIGTLPQGLAMSESGVISGTPTQQGDFSFSAAVLDSANPVQKSTTAVDLHVYPAAPIPNNTIANATPMGWEPTTLSLSPYTDGNGVAAPDTDYYKLLVQGGTTVQANTYILDGNADTVLELLDSTGARMKTCNNPADDNPPSFIVKDTTPAGYDDDCVNDDRDDYSVASLLAVKVPGAANSIQTIYAHVVDYRGDARPDLTYLFYAGPLVDPFQLRNLAVMPTWVGKSYTWGPSWTGGIGAISLALGAGSSLPPGLALTSNMINGTPTTPGQYSFKLQAKDSANPQQVSEASYELAIYPKLTLETKSLPDAKLDVPYDAAIMTTGGGKLRYRLSPNSWPCCLYIREDGHIIGTPRQTGMFGTWVNVEDDAGQWASALLTLNVTGGALQVNTFSLPAAKAGASYAAALSASGGTQPYTWRVVAGSLPPGVTLDGGRLLGDPTRSGTYAFTVEAREPGASGQVASVTLTMKVE